MENVSKTIEKKERQFAEMQAEMNKNINSKQYGLLNEYERKEYKHKDFLLIKGDSCIEIKTIPIFNSVTQTSTAYISIEPQNSDVDNFIQISDSEDGPWYGVRYNTDFTLDDADGWNTGTLSNLSVYNDYIKISANQLVGTYTTRIFENSLPLNNVFLDYTDGYHGIVSKSSDGVTRTFESRGSDIKPANLNLYVTVEVYSTVWVQFYQIILLKHFLKKVFHLMF
jgi:hypothetical protein